MEYVAIDLGSSFIKAAIVNVETCQVSSVSAQPAPPRLLGLQPDEFEVCPKAILAVVRDLLVALLAKSTNCHGILLTGQMGGLILCRPDGQPITNYISWQDQRTTREHSSGQTYFGRLSEQLGPQVATELGNEFRPGLPLSLLWYLKQTKQLVGYKSLTPLTLPDFVAASLSRITPVIEETSLTGLNSIRQAGYATSVFDQIGVGKFDWPEVVDYRHRVGEYRDTSGIGRTLPVYAATGDHQCSLVGAALRHEQLSINIATGSQMSLLSTEPEPGEYQLRPFFDNHWLKTITNIPAGRSLTSLMGLLTEINDEPINERHWQRFFDAATSTTSSDIGVNLAFFPGAITGPGHLNNLIESNLTLGHLARATLDQMASQYVQLANRFIAEDQDGPPWKQIVFSGGLAQKSPLLRRLVGDAIKSPSRLCDENQDSLAGLMILGRVIAGFDTNVISAVASNSE